VLTRAVTAAVCPATLPALRPTTRPALLGTWVRPAALSRPAALPRPPLLRCALLLSLLLVLDEVLQLLRGLINLPGVPELLTGQVGELVDPVLDLVAVFAQQRLGLALEIVEVDHRPPPFRRVRDVPGDYEAITHRWGSPVSGVRIG
jgi:hypothetical protein